MELPVRLQCAHRAVWNHYSMTEWCSLQHHVEAGHFVPAGDALQQPGPLAGAVASRHVRGALPEAALGGCVARQQPQHVLLETKAESADVLGGPFSLFAQGLLSLDVLFPVAGTMPCQSTRVVRWNRGTLEGV